MKKFLVGIDGSNTPDPRYWRERNEFIMAHNAEEASKIWCYLKGEWLREDEIPFIKVVEVPLKVDFYFPTKYEFTKTGIREVEDK